MLQWMGGGRRKVKTTKKSIQARQHQFFEQRRQQLRSQTVQELNSDKFSRQHEHIYSLDIASLKNLSQLAQLNANNQFEGSKRLSYAANKSDESKKSLCPEENVGIYQNGNLHCTGSKPSTLDTRAHVRATVGTQWTPASAAAAVALSHPEGIALQGICANPAKGVHLKNEEPKREKETSRIHASPKQEKNIQICHVQKRPVRKQRFDQFQILDLINDSHESAQCKKDTLYENYAAYVLEGMGNVPNCTPKIKKVGHRNPRYNEAIAACNSKHETQQPLQDLNKERGKKAKCKVQLQRHSVSTMDDDHEAVTDMESFSDSNGEHCSGPCKMKTYESFGMTASGECKMRNNNSFKNQYSREMNIWDRLHCVNSNVDQLSSWALFKEQGFLGPDFTTQSYQKFFESPKSVGFALDENLFPICSNYGSAIVNNGMDDHMHNELWSDDDLRNFQSSVSSDDGTQNLQFGRFTDDKLLMIDSSSPTASSQPLFERAPHVFSFNSPATELFSESTFEFQMTALDSSILEKDLESPALWERKLDAPHQHSNRVNYVDMSPAHSQDDNEFGFFNSSKHDNTEICAVGNLTEHTCSIYDGAAGETESSSVDTVFGASILGFALSPTSPLFNQPHHLEYSFGKNLR